MGCNGSKTKENTHSKINSSKSNHIIKQEIQNNNNNLVVFVLGGPGSGKGTQCSKLKDNHNFVHISTGDLLRDEQEKNGPDAEYIRNTLADGKLVKSDILVKLINNKFKEYKNTKFLLDGFPRSQENIDSWDAIISTSITAPLVLFFECSDETMTKRILSRALTSGRIDDNEEAIKKRLKVFHDQTLPIIKAYESLNKIKVVNCEGLPEDVYTETERCLKELNIIS